MFLGKDEGEEHNYKLLDLVHAKVSAVADRFEHSSGTKDGATLRYENHGSIPLQQEQQQEQLEKNVEKNDNGPSPHAKVEIVTTMPLPTTTATTQELAKKKMNANTNDRLPKTDSSPPAQTHVPSQDNKNFENTALEFKPTVSVARTTPASPAPATSSNNTLVKNNLFIDRNYKSPDWIYGPGVHLKIEPTIGHHRFELDAVFAFAMNDDLFGIVRFVGSLLRTGYTGDIVLGISPTLSQTVEEFIHYHAQYSHLVAYEIHMECQDFVRQSKTRSQCTVQNMYLGKDQYLPDSRPRREKTQLRFELFWAWSLKYSPLSRIFLLDYQDVYFQSDPFGKVEANINTTLHVYEEWNGRPIKDDPSNSRWIRAARGKEWLEKISENSIICSGTTLGGKPAIEMYTRAMVAQWDDTLCSLHGCDQGHHNVLVHGGLLEGVPNITNVVHHAQGTGVANSVGLLALHAGGSLRSQGHVDNTTNLILNDDGSPSPVVHKFDKDEEMLAFILCNLTNSLLLEWNTTFQNYTSHKQ